MTAGSVGADMVEGAGAPTPFRLCRQMSYQFFSHGS